jgi:hypothetical protein
MTMDELYGNLTTYEMRTYKENGQPYKESYFKYTKKIGNKEHKVE